MIKRLPMCGPATVTAVFLSVLFWLPVQCLAAQNEDEEQQFETIVWPDLIPEDVLEILMNPPAYISETEDGSIEDQIDSNIKNAIATASDDPYQQALISTEVRPEMNGLMIRLPGFVVPLEFNEDQVITQFFLVPYFGACLHMPPPPPNQIVLVDAPRGLTVEELSTPLWISGKLSTQVTENDMAMSTYSLQMMDYEPY
ncbi:DUF3299 domain-containing protein [Halioglobus sp. Uisw_031]|uniref:DUF3299 domain-containing protein n=1 Tax=Halioglobus sp. Uisw_031 TaxID=3230977 RepID=UPI0039EACEC0